METIHDWIDYVPRMYVYPPFTSIVWKAKHGGMIFDVIHIFCPSTVPRALKKIQEKSWTAAAVDGGHFGTKIVNLCDWVIIAFKTICWLNVGSLAWTNQPVTNPIARCWSSRSVRGAKSSKIPFANTSKKTRASRVLLCSYSVGWKASWTTSQQQCCVEWNATTCACFYWSSRLSFFFIVRFPAVRSIYYFVASFAWFFHHAKKSQVRSVLCCTVEELTVSICRTCLSVSLISRNQAHLSCVVGVLFHAKCWCTGRQPASLRLRGTTAMCSMFCAPVELYRRQVTTPECLFFVVFCTAVQCCTISAPSQETGLTVCEKTRLRFWKFEHFKNVASGEAQCREDYNTTVKSI